MYKEGRHCQSKTERSTKSYFVEMFGINFHPQLNDFDANIL